MTTSPSDSTTAEVVEAARKLAACYEYVDFDELPEYVQAEYVDLIRRFTP